ncbi:MAG TPA: hypothetical protein VFK57_10350 [Vicinamibacterales bacterium]|nr:hypothetical protein [Vicinamibacterales bacterium]
MAAADSDNDFTMVALRFARALTDRDYAAAYEMTSRDYRRGVTLEAMRTAFESMVPAEFGAIGSVEAGLTMDSWPDKQPADAGWVYVSIAGDVYSEAVTVVVTREDGALKVRAVEFGRP